MRSAKSWSATDVDSIIVPQGFNRERLTIQIHSGGCVYLAFGEKAKVGEGIRLCSDHDMMTYAGPLVCEAVHAICEEGQAAIGGYQLYPN